MSRIQAFLNRRKQSLVTRSQLPITPYFQFNLGNHERRVGEEEKTKIRVVSREIDLPFHIETYQLELRKPI